MIGNVNKFFEPKDFTDPSIVQEAIAWMKSTENIFFRHGTTNIPLNAIEMPKDYQQGNHSNYFQTAYCIAAMLYALNNSTDKIKDSNITDSIGLLNRNRIRPNRGMEIELNNSIPETVMRVINGSLFEPLLVEYVRYGRRIITEERTMLILSSIYFSDKYTIRIDFGQIAGGSKHGIRTFYNGSNLKMF